MQAFKYDEASAFTDKMNYHIINLHKFKRDCRISDHMCTDAAVPLLDKKKQYFYNVLGALDIVYSKYAI